VHPSGDRSSDGDPRFHTPLLSIPDAARCLALAPQTFRSWASSAEGGRPLVHVLPAEGIQARVPFIALAEAHVLAALRHAGLRVAKARGALTALQRQFGREYVLAARELATDGIDLLWDFSRSSDVDDTLMVAGTNQIVFREIVTGYMRYLTWADDGYPRMMRLPAFEPSDVVVDPARAFGQPIFHRARVRVADVAAMVKAGEDPRAVAAEYEVTDDDVWAATRVFLGKAA
jgi:uncharacterized protein (DUF433 family)